MATKRTIRPGESTLELAYEAGFDSWKRVWNHEANAELRTTRKDPQVLLPGDEITVPERETTPKERCPVDKEHRFRLTRPRAWVNLRMLDDGGEPLAGARYELRIDGASHGGVTDDDGLLSVEIRPNAHAGVLRLWLPDVEEPFETPVKVGHLDPVSSWSGTRDRLMNLGFAWAGDAHDDLSRDQAEDSSAVDYVFGGREQRITELETLHDKQS